MSTATIAADAASIDPFDIAFLEDPLPVPARLRDAGAVVRLEKYDVYAMARYDAVHSALVNWQTFQSGAGVGLTNFHLEKPWRPPSLLLEADPPHHDAPREVVTRRLTPRRSRDWNRSGRGCRSVVDDCLSGPMNSMPSQSSPKSSRSGSSPTRSVSESRTRAPPPLRRPLFNAFGPANHLVTNAAPTWRRDSRVDRPECLRENLAETASARTSGRRWTAAT